MSFMDPAAFDNAIDVAEGAGNGLLGEVFQATASIVAESSSFDLKTGTFEVAYDTPTSGPAPYVSPQGHVRNLDTYTQ